MSRFDPKSFRGRQETLRLWELDWEFRTCELVEWDDGARPFINSFLTLHSLGRSWFGRWRKPAWNAEDFEQLLRTLACAGYGWLRPEGVRRELEKMARDWQGPPPLLST